MKRNTKPANKIPKLFNLSPAMISLIKKEAALTSRTQTKVLEMALAQYFAVKR